MRSKQEPSPPDWVVTKEFLTFASDEQLGFVFSNPNRSRRILVIRRGDQFVGFNAFKEIVCEGFCLIRDGLEGAPLRHLNELFGVVALVYRDSKKTIYGGFDEEDAPAYQDQSSSSRLVPQT